MSQLRPDRTPVAGCGRLDVPNRPRDRSLAGSGARPRGEILEHGEDGNSRCPPKATRERDAKPRRPPGDRARSNGIDTSKSASVLADPRIVTDTTYSGADGTSGASSPRRPGRPGSSSVGVVSTAAVDCRIAVAVTVSSDTEDHCRQADRTRALTVAERRTDHKRGRHTDRLDVREPRRDRAAIPASSGPSDRSIESRQLVRDCLQMHSTCLTPESTRSRW